MFIPGGMFHPAGRTPNGASNNVMGPPPARAPAALAAPAQNPLNPAPGLRPRWCGPDWPATTSRR